MNPFEAYLLQHVAEICRNSGRPARPVALSARTGLPERTIQRYLNNLERSGKVKRATPKTGWIAVGCGLDQRTRTAAQLHQLDFFTHLGWDYKTAVRAVA